MTRRNKDKPTESELAILSVLWTHGPCTVRDVHKHLDDGVGYTTTLKLMQIMAEKGLVTRDESQRAHIYTTSKPRDEVQGNLVTDLADRAFAGSASRLVMQALANRTTSQQELEEIRALLDKLEDESS
jgi:BlaI family transcriptional regulator, penicillinase repressor